MSAAQGGIGKSAPSVRLKAPAGLRCGQRREYRQRRCEARGFVIAGLGTLGWMPSDAEECMEISLPLVLSLEPCWGASCCPRPPLPWHWGRSGTTNFFLIPLDRKSLRRDRSARSASGAATWRTQPEVRPPTHSTARLAGSPYVVWLGSVTRSHSCHGLEAVRSRPFTLDARARGRGRVGLDWRPGPGRVYLPSLSAWVVRSGLGADLSCSCR